MPLRDGRPFRPHDTMAGLILYKAQGNAVEFSQRIRILKDQVAQLLPVQPFAVKYIAKPAGQRLSQGRAGTNQFVIDYITVQYLHIHPRQNIQSCGLSRTGSAGDAK